MRREMLQADEPTVFADPSSQILEMIADSGRAVLLLQAPAERILAASPAAQQLLNPSEPAGLVGRFLSELTVSAPPEAPMLLAAGRLNGYETRRTVRGAASDELLDIWLRTVDEDAEPRLALAIVSRADEPSGWSAESTESMISTVIGATDESLTLDRISDNVETFLGLPPADVLGQSLLRLVSPHDVADLLYALARATSTQEGVGLQVRMLGPGRREQRCQLVILPLSPQPSCAFALQPAHEVSGPAASSADLHGLLRRLGEGIQAAGTARDLTGAPNHRNRKLAELTAREGQIVSRLLAGDRVPAIARQLFLAQSTVRNHLSAVFSKLGVRSQQELIVLMRQSQGGSSDG
ncbi:MAG: LuxR C-terminal-related transcriptional regulator [Jatrophihabitantaceae bacterium]